MKQILIIILATSLLCNGCSTESTDMVSASDSLSAAANADENVFTKDLADLKDFPKNWVMLTNITPDSIIGNYVVMYDTDSAYYGTASIVSENGKFVMTVKDYLAADVYEIKSCKRVAEAEMIYYNFELLLPGSKEVKKLQVNYRENPENPQSSVWFFTGPSGQESMEFVSKGLSKHFKSYYNNDEY